MNDLTMPPPNSKVILVPTHANAPSAGTPAKPKPDFKETLQKLGDKMRERLGAVLHRSDTVFDADKLMKDIEKQLVSERRAIVLRFMGIEFSFGEMRPIHGDSTKLNQEIKTRVENAVQRWIDDNPDFFDNEVLSAIQDKRIQVGIRKKFAEQLEWRINGHAEKAADRIARDMAKELEKEVRGHMGINTGEE